MQTLLRGAISLDSHIQAREENNLKLEVAEHQCSGAEEKGAHYIKH